ncbi:glutathione peroxidase [Roseospira visakhapatnamensis]|uniref:Glutathione peroxidase n=1 Tax=Roseospira visakhapatnamensis TaxID=390880 RepID=A0A7W6RGL8_9PROT|nr:glutathione peroxidase [Roseospira visakhapatnamensis]MBB4267674.1 glutathione peroxidase [Roseospira visakhapatnamensis]
MSHPSLGRRLGGLASAALTAVGLGAAQPDTASAAGQTAHDFSFTSIDGEDLPFRQFAGKAVLVVNTASFCGLTRQYDGLQAIWERYEARGLVVLGVPSNDFGSQEPNTEDRIKTFCSTKFNVSFPMTSKVRVIGAAAHPFYAWAREQVGVVGSPKWNFHKYLVGPDGRLLDWFSSTTGPESGKLTKAIEEALPRPATD